MRFELLFESPGALSYALAALAFLAFAAYLALGRRTGLRAALLLGAAGASALWAALNVALAATQAPVFWHAQALADAARAGAWLLFLAVLLKGGRWSAALFALPFVAWAAIYVPAGDPRLVLTLLLGVAVAGLVLVEQVFRRAPEQARWAIKPLCLGLGGGFAYDLYLYADALLFGGLDADLLAARGFAQALAVPFVALATARNKDWASDIAFSRGVVFHSTAFVASGVFLLIVAAAGYYVRYFGGSWGKTLQAGFLFAAALLLAWLFFSGTLRSRLRVFINKHFFAYRYDYREEWLRFTRLLSASAPGVSAGQRSIEALANLVESPGGALWLREANGEYALAARWNLPELPASQDAGAPLAAFLARTAWVLDLHEYRRHPTRYPGLEFPDWLDQVRAAWLVVPLFAQEELLGFVVLATPRAAIELNWEVRDLLKTAARQVGGFLAQIRASEALLEARKFDAFNKMAAFVVHDLKNLVAQLALLLKNAERHRHNPRFQEDMLATVRHVAERMNKLLSQLGSGGRAEENLVAIDLARLLHRVVEERRPERGAIEVEAAGALTTLAHEQRLERTLGHLVQNAIDATREGGVVRVQAFAEGEELVVEIADTGCGMSEAFVRERLFRPFQSTKADGMGIGAYETSQYLREIGGRIEAHSQPGKGTRIRVTLPLAEAARAVA